MTRLVVISTAFVEAVEEIVETSCGLVSLQARLLSRLAMVLELEVALVCV